VIQYIVTLIFVLFAVWIVVIVDPYTNNIVKYDCGMAAWHPDIPIKAKNECRKRRLE
jgi:hypothetical protein